MKNKLSFCHGQRFCVQSKWCSDEKYGTHDKLRTALCVENIHLARGLDSFDQTQSYNDPGQKITQDKLPSHSAKVLHADTW